MAEAGRAQPPTLEEALGLVRAALSHAIRAEQLVDGLTGLANEAALTEWLQGQIEGGDPFWAAFVEIDRFKSINDEFGYSNANALLVRVADQLKGAARDFFPGGALPIRAHGDEFYLVGSGEVRAEDLDGALEHVRRNIGAVRLNCVDRARPASCTASIGWALSADVRDNMVEGLKDRTVLRSLELAMARAKWSRDCVVRFGAGMLSVETAEGRADCGGCHAKFTVVAPLGARRDGQLWCPNCGGEVERPVGLRPEALGA